MATIIVYISSVAGNLEVKKQQQRIGVILQENYKGNEVTYVDVASSEDAKAKMRELSGNPSAVPPQICNGDTYCGDFKAFDNAVEDGELEKFLKL